MVEGKSDAFHYGHLNALRLFSLPLTILTHKLSLVSLYRNTQCRNSFRCKNKFQNYILLFNFFSISCLHLTCFQIQIRANVYTSPKEYPFSCCTIVGDSDKSIFDNTPQSVRSCQTITSSLQKKTLATGSVWVANGSHPSSI